MRAVSNKTRIETEGSITLFPANERMRAVSNKTRIETEKEEALTKALAV